MMSREDLVSVIIPIYNTGEFLDECIESVCRQTYVNLEILLVDDGSTDESGKIADEWCVNDSRCRVFHRMNRGQSAARNFGILHARGKYIVFLDSDDMLSPNMIERLHQEMCSEQVGIVFCGFTRKTSSGEYVKGYQTPSRIYGFEEFLGEMYNQENCTIDNSMFLPCVSPVNKMYKAHLFDKIQYPEGRINEDNAIIHRIVFAAQNVKWINEPLYTYRERLNSTMTSTFSKRRIDDFYAQLDRIEFVKDKITSKLLWNAMVARCLDTGRRYWCKINAIGSWSAQERKETYQDIKGAYRMYADEDTFSFPKGLIWSIYIHIPNVYYTVWSAIRKFRNKS